jgi:hypothetical protein
MGIRNTAHTTSENDPSSNDDEQQQDNLHDCKQIHAPDTPLGKESVEQRDEDNNADCNATFGPFSDVNLGCFEDVFGEDDASRSCNILSQLYAHM